MSELKQYPVIYEQTVAWGDMDAFGHVNNAMYYRYVEALLHKPICKGFFSDIIFK
jgi:acyl-CoA thioesterase FadM